GLMVRTPTGRATSPLARKISRRWYTFADSDRVRAISLDFTSRVPAIAVRTGRGSVTPETRTPFGVGTWVRSPNGFANGIERLLAVPEQPAVALSGAWTADSVFTLKIVAPETPYYSTVTFQFHGDSLTLDGEHNVAFGPIKQPRLVGHIVAANPAP
ncbi:MAG: hypothetical protein ACJ79J_12530, partial [Gemmatimonadaceae bacterium]